MLSRTRALPPLQSHVPLCFTALLGQTKLLSVGVTHPVPFYLTTVPAVLPASDVPFFQLSIVSLNVSFRSLADDTSFLMPFFTDPLLKSSFPLLSSMPAFPWGHVCCLPLASLCLCQCCFPSRREAQGWGSQTSRACAAWVSVPALQVPNCDFSVRQLNPLDPSSWAVCGEAEWAAVWQALGTEPRHREC